MSLLKIRIEIAAFSAIIQTQKAGPTTVESRRQRRRK
jgi:hypothetical protein